MRGADGTVDMWVSKTHAARRESSILSLPTISYRIIRRVGFFLWKEWVYFLVRSSKLITSGCRNIVGICRNAPTVCLIKLSQA